MGVINPKARIQTPSRTTGMLLLENFILAKELDNFCTWDASA
jgi:hypothetical protein